MSRFNNAAYRRNVKKACEALGNAVPRGFQTTSTLEGRLVVYCPFMTLRGRLEPHEVEPFK